MGTETSTFRDAFLEDHRRLTRGLRDLLDAIERDDLVVAVHLADELDRVAGPHIEFEETAFYPAIAPSLGEAESRQLYQEHQEGLEAVRRLRAHDPERPLDEGTRRTLLGQLQVALDHVVSCGALLSHLVGLDAAQEADLLAKLEVARQRGRRWTELPVHRPDEPPR